jgi:hypothetical protein
MKVFRHLLAKFLAARVSGQSCQSSDLTRKQYPQSCYLSLGVPPGLQLAVIFRLCYRKTVDVLLACPL